MRPRYKEMRPIIEQAARRAAYRFHLDRDDMISDAQFIYVKAVRTWDGVRPFENHLRTKLRRLANPKQLAARRNRILHRVYTRLNAIPVPRHWTDDLSEPAMAVVRLAVASRAGLRPGQIRRQLKKYLRDVGFAASQVEEMFQEIAFALTH